MHVRYFWQLIDGDIIAARRTRETIRHLQQFVPQAYRGPATALDALPDAISETDEVDLPVPQGLTLFRISSALAGGEAVAIGGTRENAAHWYSWFTTTWPTHVLRGPVWPVLAHRVRALLACRSGDPVAGLAWIEQAISVADRIGSPVESAIARIQCAELLALDPSQTLESTGGRSGSPG